MSKESVHIVPRLFGWIARHINRRLGVKLLSYLPSSVKNYEAIVSFQDIKISVYTGETIGKQMYYFHDFELEQTDTFLSLLTPGMIFFDIGANVGLYALLAAKRGARTYAFEPFPRVLELLRRSIVLNGLEASVTEVPEAVSDHNGTIEFYPPRAGNLGVGKVFLSPGEDLSEEKSVGTPITVPTHSLDTYVQRFEKPDLIKIDIEGGEYFLLRTLPAVLLLPDAPMLFIEFHLPQILSFGGSVEELLATLKKAGYLRYGVQQSLSSVHEWYVFSKRPLQNTLLQKQD